MQGLEEMLAVEGLGPRIIELLAPSPAPNASSPSPALVIIRVGRALAVSQGVEDI